MARRERSCKGLSSLGEGARAAWGQGDAGSASPSRWLVAALDAIEQGVIISDTRLEEVLYANTRARLLLDRLGTQGGAIPETIAAVAVSYAASRRALGHPPPAVRVELPDGGCLYLRAITSDEHPGVEILVVREEVIREPELFRDLNARYGVTRVEFQVVKELRRGVTNVAIAEKLKVSPHTVSGVVRRLLRRFDAPNRTALAERIERIASRRS